MEYLDRDTFYPAYSKSAKAEYIHSGRPPLPLSYTRRVEGMLGKPETEKMHVQGEFVVLYLRQPTGRSQVWNVDIV